MNDTTRIGLVMVDVEANPRCHVTIAEGDDPRGFVHIGSPLTVLQLNGEPEALRQLAKGLEDAAMEAERLLADREKVRAVAHYAALDAEAQAS